MPELVNAKGQPTILIVDDTPANLTVLAEILKSRGYQVRVAPSGRLALQFVARSQPDLILLDVSMPDMDGYEVCRQLKKNDSWKSIPVIFISALTDTQGKVRSFEAGGVDFITKPFHCSEVEARVETHIKLYFYQRKLEELVDQKVRELVQAKEKVAKAEKVSMVGIMAAGIAHEINQPLNAIKLLASNLVLTYTRGREREITEYIDGFKEISRQTDRIHDIIEHLRSYIHDDGGKVHPCNINEAIENSLKIVGKQLRAHGISVEQDLQSQLANISATATGLETIVLNLLANSLNAFDTIESINKKITLRTYMDHGVVLEIADNGPGISKELRETIFEPFVTSQNGIGNMGLGLAIVKSILFSYKGRIELLPDKEHETVFKIAFPAIIKEV